MSDENEPIPCGYCWGTGYIEQERVVSHDMAVDAGDRSMEGTTFTNRYLCQHCGGSGYVYVQ